MRASSQLAWRVLLAGAWSCLALPAAAATVWHVPGDPGAATIGEALAAARPGDVVLVAAGVYVEHGLVLPDGVALRSETGLPDGATIDAGGVGRALIVRDVGPGASVRGFTFTGGRADGASPGGLGGAVLCERASPLFADCAFVGNGADRGGAVHCLDRASPEFRRCSFVTNEAASLGGAVACHDGSSPAFTACLFAGNTAGVLGGALALSRGSRPTLTRCTVAGGGAELGSAISAFDDAGAALTACIVAFNEGGRAVQCDASAVPAIAASDIFGHDGGDWVDNLAPLLGAADNQAVDPQFCGDPAAGGPFTLRDTSPYAAAAAGAGGAGGAGDTGALRGALPVGCWTSGSGPAPATRLRAGAPNPFNAATAFRFELAAPGRATLRIYSPAGRLVATLVDADLPAGSHTAAWTGRDDRGREAASGVYFCRLEAGGQRLVQRVVLVK